VFAHEALGQIGLTGRDGLDDTEVLLEPHGGPPGQQGDAELVADTAEAQPVEHVGGGALPRHLADPQVHVLADLAVGHDVAALHRGLQGGAQLAQLLTLGRGGPGRRPAGAQSFEHRADFGDLDRLFLGDRAHPRAAVGLPHREPLVVQQHERLTHRAPGRRKPLRQLAFDESLPGVELADEDRLADRVGHGGGVLQPFSLAWRRRHVVVLPARKLAPLRQPIASSGIANDSIVNLGSSRYLQRERVVAGNRLWPVVPDRHRRVQHRAHPRRGCARRPL
jgi:hypothetical protein